MARPMPDDLPPEPPSPAPPPLPELRVIHRDESVIAVSKPSGLLVHRDVHHPEEPAALQLVRDQVGAYVYPFHRLDRPTSGILMFGLSSAAAAAWQAALADASAHKDYLALMRWPGSNRELPDEWSCTRALSDEKDVPRDARTDFALVERFRRCALARCRIFTGRYHQIRRHANHSGRHVIGDTTHGKGRINGAFRDRYGIDRLFLHLHRIVLTHPYSGSPLELLDPMPMDLETSLAKLRADGTTE